LIAPDIILTAGHCHGFFTHIRVNMYNLKQELESFEVFKAERMHFHPNFDELWFRYDFLLLQLNGTVRGVEPVRINADDSLPIPDDPLTVVGWGLTDPEDTAAYPDELREVTVKYVSNDSCEQTTSNGQRLYEGYIFDDMMCAYSSGQDACSGDSGAPLIRPGSSPTWDVVVAVVSWGKFGWQLGLRRPQF
jgi:Trypsin